MKFEYEIKPQDKFLNLRIKEIWLYRDLIMLFVTRDFVAKFKQTLLGPLWFIVQPLLTMITYTFIFGNVAALPTDGIPKNLFYLAGITSWNYFAGCLKTTSTTFTKNATLFGKVYFPRVVTPISVIVSNLIQFGIQLFLFLILFFYYLGNGADIQPSFAIWLLPLLIIIMGIMGLGIGMIISSLTTKYRDLKNLVQFGVQLLMYASPVIYPISQIPEKYKWIILANPMSGIIETFKFAFLGKGYFSWNMLIYSASFTIVIFVFGLLIFNRTEKNFMDTV